jgi:hypothetical protein
MEIRTIIRSIAMTGVIIYTCSASAQVQGNNTTYANPSSAVQTTTTGGTNINYQTNNSYNSDFGFAPGIFCRTPMLILGGSAGLVQQQSTDDPYIATEPNPLSYAYNNNLNTSANIGVSIPIGSSVIEDCKAFAKQISLDRQISSQLSMIRACASLEKEGIKVDANKYPLLAICSKDNAPPNQTLKTLSISPNTKISPTPKQVLPVPPIDARKLSGSKGT